MAKKFVRGITDVKNINKQDYDTNNVNDLLSDGEHNYIHRKKNKKEEYHNLTNNIKTIQTDNPDLLSVTNYNNTKNSATLHPHHDAQKEQVLNCTNNTITISHGENGTTQKTTVGVNTKKVLTHDNLVSNSQYVTLSHAENSDKTQITTDKLDSKISELETKVNQSSGGVNLPYVEFYGHSNAFLRTETTPLFDNVYNFYFFFNMYKGKTQASFDLTPDDVENFSSLFFDLSSDNTVNINGVVFTLDGQTLSATTNNATNHQFLTTFSTMGEKYDDDYDSGGDSGGGGFN